MPRKVYILPLAFIIICGLCQLLPAKTPPSIPVQDYTIWGQLHLKDPQQSNAITLTHTDSVYTVSLKIGNETLASYTMGSDYHNIDYYVLKVPMSSAVIGQNTAKSGDSASIFINGISVSEAYLEPAHTNIGLPITIGNPGQTVMMDFVLFIDRTPPYVTNHNPQPDSSANRETSIYAEVKDDGTGVDLNSLQMSVEGSIVSPLITSISGGYALTYNPPDKFLPDQVVDVIISAKDLSTPPNIISPLHSYHFVAKNRLPMVKELTITPSNPKTGEVLECHYVYSDGDGDTENGTEIKWYRNEVYQSTYKNKASVSTIKKGQVWYVTVRPKDGTDFGEVYKSSSVTIVNTAPSVSDLKLIPSDPIASDDLVCGYDYSDTDGDSESGSEIRWYIGGVLQGTYNDQNTVPSSAVRKGDKWSFSIRPKDGTDFGEIQTSSELLIGNSPPVAVNVVITPSSPKEMDKLTCIYDYTDADGDVESGTTLRWYRNDSLQSKYNDQKEIPVGVIKSDEQWKVTVRVSDGTVQGKYVSSEIVTVGNTAPIADGLIVELMLTGDLTAKYTYSDAGGDAESGSEIKWYKDGIEQTTYVNQKLIPSIATAKGERWHFTVKPKDGTDYGEVKESSDVTIGNTSPIASNLVILPVNPLMSDELAGSYDYSDGNGDAENGSEIKWYKDGIEQVSYTGKKIISSVATAKLERWHFSVKPKDGTDYGELKVSPDVVIGNTLPQANDVTIAPSSPKTGDVLECHYVYSDGDGDTENGSEIKWYRNEVYQSSYKNKVIVSTIKKGQVWYVTVKPKDGTDFGELYKSSIVTIENTAPIADELKIKPDIPLIGDDFTCSYNYNDPDDDPENGTEIRWYRNGVINEKFNDQTVIPSSEISNDDKWYFTVRPNDGTDFGELKTSPEVSTGNIIPVASNLKITLNLLDDNLVCSYKYSDANGDVENGTEIRWYKDDVLQEAYNDQKVIPSNVLIKGQIWQFTVKPKDGIDYGELKKSPTLKIGNTLPNIKELNITPAKPLTSDILECKYEYYDTDGDPENGTEIRWYKDGIYHSSYKDKLSVSAGSTKKGQVWYVTVRPSDGTDFGEIQQSVSVLIGNTSPVAEELKIQPLNPLTGNDLTCSYSYKDADSDPESGTEIKWYKDEVLQAEYNNQTQISNKNTLKGERWHFTTRPKDGTDHGELKVSSNVTIGNTPPSAANLDITPSNPTPENTLSCGYQYSDPDADAENGTQIKWYKNGKLQTKYSNIITIQSTELESSQTWYFVVQPCDGIQFGETKQSNPVTIGDRTPVISTNSFPPEATNLRISPEKPLTKDNLKFEYKYTDADGNPENGSEIRWYKNGILQNSYNDKNIVPASDTSRGENWYFTVKPKDGETFGELKTSPTVTIANTPPIMANVSILPVLPKKTDNLVCDYVYSDADMDVENGTEIRWYKNSELQSSYNDIRIIPPSDVVKGQKWYCTIRPKDGTDFGNLQKSTVVTIGNTTPIAVNLTISPLLPLTADDLICSYEYTDVDNDAETGTEIKWYKDEDLQSSYNNRRKIPADETAKGQKWYFTVKLRDGTFYGEIQKSPVITIGDTPPAITDMTITPALPVKGDSLVCHYILSDADSDPETGTEIRWYKNDKQQTKFNNQTLIPSSAFTKGEKWYYAIRTLFNKKYTDWQNSPAVIIKNSPPSAVIESENYIAAIESPIRFYGSKSSDADNDQLSYKWDFDTNNSVSVDSTEQNPLYVYESEGDYIVTLTVNDGEADSEVASIKVRVEAKLKLLEVSYNIPDTKLILKFNKPIKSEAKEFDGEKIRMEIADSGKTDLQLYGKCLPILNWMDPSEVLIDTSNSLSTALGLVLAGVVNHQKVNLTLPEGVFVDTSGIKNQPVTGSDNMTIEMISGRFKVGLIGDVNGNGTVTTYDAELVVQSSVSGIQTLPIYNAAMDVSRWLSIYEYNYDSVMDIVDLDRDGQVSSYDAFLIMQKASKLVSGTSILATGSAYRKATLKINHRDTQGMDASIILDDSSGIFSIDLIITYNPQELTVKRAAKSLNTSDWLFAQAVSDPGKLRISLAGISPPKGNGSIIDVSLGSLIEDGTQLPNITGIQLNGRKIGVLIENTPDQSALLQNYPNPCKSETWIPYLLSSESEVHISIYNSNGEIVRKFDLGAKVSGHYVDKSSAVYWDCRNESGEMVSSGIYFYELRAGKYISTKKMVVTQR
jgi:hypothetical protein